MYAMCHETYAYHAVWRPVALGFILFVQGYIMYGSGYLQSSSAHRRRTLAYLQSRDEPIKALGSSHMTK